MIHHIFLSTPYQSQTMETVLYWHDRGSPPQSTPLFFLCTHFYCPPTTCYFFCSAALPINGTRQRLLISSGGIFLCTVCLSFQVRQQYMQPRNQSTHSLHLPCKLLRAPLPELTKYACFSPGCFSSCCCIPPHSPSQGTTHTIINSTQKKNKNENNTVKGHRIAPQQGE